MTGRDLIGGAVELIESMPAWSEISVDDATARSKIIDSLKELAKYDLQVLREAINEYLSKSKRSASGYDVAAMSRLYVLNRYVFDVPTKVSAGLRRFGSFFGIPSDSEWVNELWPLSTDEHGNLELTSGFSGYFGESYLALQEFDYFSKTYGPRKRSGQ